jgi:hypothetical protein
MVNKINVTILIKYSLRPLKTDVLACGGEYQGMVEITCVPLYLHWLLHLYVSTLSHGEAKVSDE